MKRMLLLSLVLLLALAFAPGTTHAATIPCTVSPDAGPIGTTFVVSCTGLAPGEYTTAWATEPDGAAWAFPGVKADSAGNVGYAFFSGGSKEAKPAVGTWGFTVEQFGAMGVVHFTVTGGTKDVAGAVLTANGTLVTGSGFAAGEPVSIWVEFPNGDCSSFTSHWQDYNDPIEVGLSVLAWGTLKADAGGNIAFDFNGFQGSTYANLCLGNYKVVARGMDSGLGAWTTVVIEGNSVVEDASLVANKSEVNAWLDSISFSGAGFGANELVTCWVTTPQGATSGVHFNLEPVRTDGGGNFGFTIFTGFSGGPYTGFFAWSEGALGEWAMTCQGGASGATGIARFTVVGNAIDP